MVQLVTGVERASSFFDRWRGLRPRPNGRRMLFRGRSVHSFGMKEALWVVGLDTDDVVTEVRRLDPGRLVWLRHATTILEMPITDDPPPSGVTVLMTDD